jgi:DNA-binding transcriptional ArsR family regulator
MRVPRLGTGPLVGDLRSPIYRSGSLLCTLTGTYPAWYTHGMEAALKALADDSRRTMLETLAEGPATAGELASLLPIARPGVSRHLRVLREAGLVEVRQEAQRRVYSLRPQPLAEINDWLSRHLTMWEQRLDALHTEIARGKRDRRRIR